MRCRQFPCGFLVDTQGEAAAGGVECRICRCPTEQTLQREGVVVLGVANGYIASGITLLVLSCIFFQHLVDLG